MAFDFDTLYDRGSGGNAKWDRRTAEEKQKGYVPLSIADMEFLPAPCIKRAVLKAAEGIYGYTDPETRYFDAVVNWMNARHNMDIAPEEVVCYYGVVPALFTAVRAFTEPGDKIIIQTPVYFPFETVVSRQGRELARNPLIESNGQYAMDYAHLESLARDPKAKLLILCSPHNPVGRVWTRAELTRLGEICAENNVLVISDEIHADIVFSGRHTAFSTLDERIARRSVILTSTSKSFNLAGLQLANVIIPDGDLRNTFKRQVDIDGYSNISHFGYAATIAAYNEGAEWLDALIAYLRENIEFFTSFIARVFPSAVISPLEGTYLPWVNFKCLGLDPKQLEYFMRVEAGLFLDEGYLFGTGGEGYERFNIALPRAELRKALDRLEAAGRARGFL